MPPGNPKWKRQDRDDGGIELALLQAGSVSALARELGLVQSTVAAWRKIPVHWVLRIAEMYNIPPHELRPDIYPKPQRRRIAR